jgi:hypothetical protein
MRRINLAFCLVLAAVLAGCSYFPPIIGSGAIIKTAYVITDFAAIQTSQSFNVRVVPDSTYSVSVSYDDNLADYLVVEKKGDSTLVISLKDGYSYQWVTLSAVVHMPTLATLDASGASRFLVESGFPALSSLSIALSGASSCQAADVRCGNLVVDVSGASSVTLTGTADSLSSVASGASTAVFTDCPTALAKVDLSGASECWVRVPAGTIHASASGASTLYYYGSPSFSLQDLSGASTIINMN